MENEITKAASILGEIGGKTKGESKRRGDSEHYARLSALGVKARLKGNSANRRKQKRARERSERLANSPGNIKTKIQ